MKIIEPLQTKFDPKENGVYIQFGYTAHLYEGTERI